MLKSWTIYDNPTDYPGQHVARMFILDKPTPEIITGRTLEQLRAQFDEWGLVCLTRHPEDDPCIVEVWL